MRLFQSLQSSVELYDNPGEQRQVAVKSFQLGCQVRRSRVGRRRFARRSS